MGLFDTLNRNTRTEAIKIMADTESWYAEDKHRVNQDVIKRFADSNFPLDQLAVALAYTGEGAKYRLNAINYFERYFKRPAVIPVYSNRLINGHPAPYFSDWTLYTTLGELYAAESMLDKAIDCYQKAIETTGGSNSSDYIRIGSLYERKDINLAIKYYESLKTQPKIWSRHERSLSQAYDELSRKQTCFKTTTTKPALNDYDAFKNSEFSHKEGDKMFCKYCGQKIESTAAYCSYCGARQNNAEIEQQPIVINNVIQSAALDATTSEKSKIAALVLCIFLGGLGVHRFYVGKIGTGILWLLTAGVFGIGWIIDIIMILCNGFKDSHDMPLCK